MVGRMLSRINVMATLKRGADIGCSADTHFALLVIQTSEFIEQRSIGGATEFYSYKIQTLEKLI